MPDHRDRYYYLAKKDDYRSRAAFKLLEIQTKFNLLRQGQNILEIGASPGGWTQVIASITKGKVVSVDVSPMKALESVIFVRGRIEDRKTIDGIREAMLSSGIEKFQGILSDAMTHTSGRKDIDHSSSYLIGQRVMELCEDLLDQDGFVLVKQFQGDLTTQFINRWSGGFRHSRLTKTAASRDSSSEVYILFTGFKD